MDSGANGRLQKTRYSDITASFKNFIDASEFPLMETWENVDLPTHNSSGLWSFHSHMHHRNPTSNAPGITQRQASLSGMTASSSSSGLGSEFSSAGTSTRFPSFSLASMESLEENSPSESQCLSPDTNFWPTAPATGSSNPMDTTKRSQRAEGARKAKRVADARLRSGSLATGSVSTVHPTDQQVQRSMSINVAILCSGNRQLNPKGNIFRQRKDFSAFQNLHPSKKNGYFIQLEDDSCTGNEDTRAFLLCQLTNHGASEMKCIACGGKMAVYDHFPVVDGALFLSPLCHRGGLQVCWNVPMSAVGSNGLQAIGGGGGGGTSPPMAGQLVQGDIAPPPGCTGPRQQQALSGGHSRQQQRRPSVSQERFLHAICMTCMRSTGDPSDRLPQIVCKFCDKPWNGSTLLIGGMYTYDPFACMPCCIEHLRCKSCGLQALSHASLKNEPGLLVAGGDDLRHQPRRRLSEGAQEEPTSPTNPLHPLPYFSQYSRLMCCQHCRVVDYHFIKPFHEMYHVRLPSA
uniref:Headcase domain-containing protein n=3 Tax=Mesocestoides corti TaxID=53468 RepID=A0A5K3EUK9_MESCO